MKDFQYIVIRRAWLWAFLFVIVMGTVGLWGLRSNQIQIRHFAQVQAMQHYQQDLNTCSSSNEGRAVLLDLVRTSNISTQAIKEDPTYPPAFLELIRQSKQESANTAARAEISLAPRDCSALFKQP